MLSYLYKFKILKCCKYILQGRSDDFNKFLSTSAPVLERLDTWMTSLRSEVTQTIHKVNNEVRYILLCMSVRPSVNELASL